MAIVLKSFLSNDLHLDFLHILEKKTKTKLICWAFFVSEDLSLEQVVGVQLALQGLILSLELVHEFGGSF